MAEMMLGLELVGRPVIVYRCRDCGMEFAIATEDYGQCAAEVSCPVCGRMERGAEEIGPGQMVYVRAPGRDRR